MRPVIFALCILFGCFSGSYAQTDLPNVAATARLDRDTFKAGEDIKVQIILTNTTKTTQTVWFDRPRFSTGGPAWTSVILTDKGTGQSVLKYENKAVLNSQSYTAEQVKNYSYKLKPRQRVSGTFSLYSLVVLKGDKQRLDRGSYEMQIFYCSNASGKINFTVE